MTRYDEYPNHPLHGIPQSALDEALEELQVAIRDGVIEDDPRAVAEALMIIGVEAERSRKSAGVIVIPNGLLTDDELRDFIATLSVYDRVPEVRVLAKGEIL